MKASLKLILLFLFGWMSLQAQTLYLGDPVGAAPGFAGKVGVGTTAPRSKLHVYIASPDSLGLTIQGTTINTDAVDHYVGLAFDGDYGDGTGNSSQIRSYSNLYNLWGSALTFHTTAATGNSLVERMRIDRNGNVGVGTTNPTRLFSINGASNAYVGFKIGDVLQSTVGSDANGDFFVFDDQTSTYRMIVSTNGNVGIGTTNPTQKLSVNGTVRAKEVIVDTGWSDYVFADDYRLAPLSEIEAHIKANKHLPGIPSAAEVAEHGVSMGDMQAKLLAKIEEITLHQIAQEKALAALSAENAVLRHQVAELTTSNR